jgi:tRNA(Ile)-lysidine synthase
LDLLNQFIHHIKSNKLFHVSDRMLLAVSGGVDSVVLCDLCHRAGLDVEIAHVNFQLRGKESDGDEQFVKALAERYNLKIHIKRFDTKSFAAAQGFNIQIAARQLRYDWFNQLIVSDSEARLKFVLTAHHASDNAETLLMHFVKGTGIRGLRGMSAHASGIGGKVVRPLLYFSRSQIEAYAQWRQLNWTEDASNASNSYTRNVIRNIWLPMMQQQVPDVAENLIDNIQRFSQAADIYEDAIKKIIKKIIVVKGNELHIPVLRIKNAKAAQTLLFEIIQPYGFSSRQLPTAFSLLQADTGKYIDSSTHRLLRNRNWMIITPLHQKSSQHFIIHETDCEIDYAAQKLHIEQTEKSPIADPAQAFLDFNKIQFPLVLRKWREGDYFYPLGMKKKKKISKFLIDNKVPLHKKNAIWVLESGQKIVWVVGMRIDDRFKISLPGQKALHINLLPAK